MQLQIVTPEKKVYTGEVLSSTFPGIGGSFQVLLNHAPMISSLDAGTITLEDRSGKKSFNISGGTIEVKDNNLVVLAESVLKD